MTVYNKTNRVEESGNGNKTEFDFAFKIFAEGNLNVYKKDTTTLVATTQVLNTDYTVSILTSGEGGTVTYATAPTSGEYSLIVRDLDIEQTTDIPPESNLPEEVLENSLDRLTMISQQLEDGQSRAISLPVTSSLSGVELPDADAGKCIKWNVTGDNLENSDYNPDAAGDADASATASAASAAEAVISALAAAASAATINLPTITSGDAEKLIEVNAAGDGYDLTTHTIATLVALIGSASAGSVPIGGTLMHNGETPPTNFLEKNGASLVKTEYAELFAVIGTLHGTADSTHFNIPDARGRVSRAWDHGAGVDPNAATRTAGATGGATGDHVGTIQTDQNKRHTHNYSGLNRGATSGGVSMLDPTGGAKSTTASGGDEARMVNINELACIRYQ